MKYKLFQNNLEESQKMVSFLLNACAALLLMMTLLIFLCISISHRSMTTLVPLNLNAPMTVSNDAISSQYLNESALSFINLRLNFDPDTIDSDHSIILRSVSPDSFNKIKTGLDQEAKLIKAQGISSNFYVDDIKINRKTLSVLVSGVLLRSVEEKPLKPITTQFQINFENQNGLLRITQFIEVKNT